MDILRILELAGRRLLSEKLTVPQARAVFVSKGFDGDPRDLAHLKSFRLQVNRRSHPDAGGDGKDAAEINAAFDTLKADLDAGGTHDRTSSARGSSWEDIFRNMHRNAKPNGAPPPEADEPEDDQGSTMRLYVYEAGRIEHYMDVADDAEAIRTAIDHAIDIGDLTDQNVVLGVNPGWALNVKVLLGPGLSRLNPPMLDRRSDVDLDQDSEFLADFPRALDHLVRRAARHAAAEREEQAARSQRRR